jgi:hypothetical protein
MLNCFDINESADEAHSSSTMQFTGRTGQNSSHALASSSPSARTLAALATTFGHPSDITSETQEGPIKLSGLLPALDYISVLSITALGYVRGCVPLKYLVGEADLSTGNHAFRVMISDDIDDEMEWTFAGLGFKSFANLHAEVAVAAAELFAKLMAFLPHSTPSSARLADKLADPLLNLMAQSIAKRDSVLQLHFLEALEAIIIAEGSGFAIPIVQTLSPNSSEWRNPRTLIGGKAGKSDGNVLVGRSPSHIGCVEAHSLFVPWLLAGLSQACKAPSDGRDVGSQEVLGLRRRWIRFACTVVKHVGTSLPRIAEGVLLTICQLLENLHEPERGRTLSGDPMAELASYALVSLPESDVSRIDERILFLTGLGSVSRSIIFAFDFAQRTASLNDNGGSDAAVILPSFQGMSSLTQSSLDLRARPTTTGSSMTGGQSMEGKIGRTVTGTVRSRPPGADNAPSFSTDSAPPLSSATANATASMINSINPLRMLNDFVKDVFTGATTSGHHGRHDPRRDAARTMFLHLPDLLHVVVEAWGLNADLKINPTCPQRSLHEDLPSFLPLHVDVRSKRAQEERDSMPRLSREIPRELRQAQRNAVLMFAEPLFAARPMDIVAAIVVMFCESNEAEKSSRRAKAIDMLHTMDNATPEVIVSCAGDLLGISLKWDAKSEYAEDGKLQLERKSTSRQVVKDLVEHGVGPGLRNLDEIKGVSVQGAAGALNAGGWSGDSNGIGASSPSTGSLRPQARNLFHGGDFFAAYSAHDVEIAVVVFLASFFSSCRDSDDVQASWPALHTIAKDVIASSSRKASLPNLLTTLAAFAGQCPTPLPDKRHRKELMQIASTVISSCSVLAAGTMDLSSEIVTSNVSTVSIKAKKAQISLLAMSSLSSSLPVLIDSSFLEDKTQLETTTSTAIVPAVTALRQTAARAAAVHNAIRDAKGELSAMQTAESAFSNAIAYASAKLVLEISRREWGVRLARRELVVLLYDPNFFFGKHGTILSCMASIVREVIASGGAAVLLSSIGTTTAVTSTGIPGLFTGRDSESVLRARAVRRVTFCVFVAEPDDYLPQLPTVLERLRDSLRLADPGLVVECLLCLRVLLLCTGPSSIAAFRATTLSEMFRIASAPANNLSETHAALQFLDLVTLLSPPDFGYERCFFFASKPSIQSTETDSETAPETAMYEPLIPKLAAMGTGSSEEHTTTTLRLEGGRTVCAGPLPASLVTPTFIGHYASLLVARNQSPAMANARPDLQTIRRELVEEFLQ